MEMPVGGAAQGEGVQDGQQTAEGQLVERRKAAAHGAFLRGHGMGHEELHLRKRTKERMTSLSRQGLEEVGAAYVT